MKAKRMLSLLLTAALMLSMVTPVLAASAETELPRASQTRLEETKEVVSIRLQASGKLESVDDFVAQGNFGAPAVVDGE